MQKECRDRKIARALLLYMTQRAEEGSHKPLRMHFSQSESNAKTLAEICLKGGWSTHRVIYQAKVLQAISKLLFEAGVLRSWTPPIGTKTISYSLSSEWLKRLAPGEWGGLAETSSAVREMDLLLDSIYPIGASSGERDHGTDGLMAGQPFVSSIPARSTFPNQPVHHQAQ